MSQVLNTTSVERGIKLSVEEAVDELYLIAPSLEDIPVTFTAVSSYCMSIIPRSTVSMILINFDFTTLPLDYRIFDLAHEYAHIKLGHFLQKGSTSVGMEIEADEQALNWLKDNPRFERYTYQQIHGKEEPGVDEE
jgi:hypothetical protein